MTTSLTRATSSVPGNVATLTVYVEQGCPSCHAAREVAEEGKKLVTATLEPGSVFGEMALAGQGMNGSFAEAAEDCDLCLMSRADIQRVSHEYPTVALQLLEGMARRLDDAEERRAGVAYKSVPDRIAATLLRLSGPDNRPVG